MIDRLESGVRELGRQLLEWRTAGLTAYRRDGTQFKAEADRRMNEQLRALIAGYSCATPIVSEEDESDVRVELSFPYWLVDPIDGTASFVQGFAGFVIQLALIDCGEPVRALVYAPVTDELFTARRGGGAFLNGRALSCTPTGHDVLIDNYPDPRGIASDAMSALGLRTYMESGSIGLKICRVAAGQADLFVKDVPVRDWDLAPGDLILSEAGGHLSDLRGRRCSYTGTGTHLGVLATVSRDWHHRAVGWVLHRKPVTVDEQ